VKGQQGSGNHGDVVESLVAAAQQQKNGSKEHAYMSWSFKFAFAPKSAWTTCKWPDLLASCRGEAPRLLKIKKRKHSWVAEEGSIYRHFAFTSDFAARRASTTERWPFWQAQCSAVLSLKK
jgi:hypothetical protein